jgi:outer membrane lipase/esterase
LLRTHSRSSPAHPSPPTSCRVRPSSAPSSAAPLLAAILALAPAALDAQGPFTSVTFFGDSYVDTGNAFLLTGGANPPPPYFQGRFSNGLVWSDYLARSLGRPGDAAPVFLTRAASGVYAVAGARSGPGGQTSTATQIGSYLTRPGGTPGQVSDPTGLYALFAGGNDLRDAGALGTAAARQAEAAAAAQRVIAQAGALAQGGARNVLLFSLGSLSATPEARAIPGRPAIQDELAATFNATLAAGLAGLNGAFGGTTFFNLRLDNLLTNILLDAQSGGGLYGITDTTRPCFGPPFGPPNPAPCDVSMWADDLHPTTRVHGLIGEAAFRYVTTGQNVAVIPEPATVLLVGAGVFVVGALARRRAA